MGKGELVDHKLFNLYELGIGEKLIFTKPTVTPIMFNNFVTIALKLNKIDLLKEFLWKRELFLPNAWSQDAITWAESKLAYQLGLFSKVITLNEKYIVQQWMYKLQMKVILLQTYYELVEAKEYRYDTLKNHLGSFKKFINRNKEKYRFRPEPYLFLIFFTKKIHKVNSKKESQMIKELKKIEEAIQKEKALFGRNWLLKKIDEKLLTIQ
jgi:hypothetical protein